MTWVFLFVVVVVVVWAITAYNKLIQLKGDTINAWKQIDVQLKRRHDLIPNLVESVKGAMEFEIALDVVDRVALADRLGNGSVDRLQPVDQREVRTGQRTAGQFGLNKCAQRSQFLDSVVRQFRRADTAG